eukprot:m.43442 g.43442  ORF g.43442 m.43442 type:complete len:258 (+) comp5781_c0_seq3:2-775(+)
MASGRLAGQVAIVTGGANGIGVAIARRFVKEGAKVTISDVDAVAGHKFVEDVTAAGGVAHFVQARSGDEDQIAAMIQASKDKFGPANILINNAAAFHFGPIETVKREDWMRLFETNVIGYSDAIKHALPGFKQHGKGAVVNLASISSFIAQPEMFVYNAVKGAVAQLTRCLALDLATQNIRVNAVAPGSTWTPASARHMKVLGVTEDVGKKMFGEACPMKRMATADEMAGPTLFLATDESSYITGQILVVDGGLTIV